MKNLVIFGTGMMARLAHFFFSRDSDYRIVAFTTDREYRTADEFQGIPVVDFEELQSTHPPGTHSVFVALGAKKMNQLREAKFHAVREKGYRMATYRSPYAVCDSPLGENSLLADMAIVHPWVEIGENNFVWEYALISDNSRVGSHGYFSPRSVVGTLAQVENNVILGTGAIIKTGVRVARQTLVGASCYISVDTKENGVYGEKSSPLLGCIADRIELS